MARIAIVEDNAESRLWLCTLAERYAGQHGAELTVDCFEGGLPFLEQYHADYDAVFLDVVMPHLDGLETAHRLRARDEDVPIIFVTSVAQYAIRGYEVWAMGFLIKPVSYEDFELKLNRAIRQSSRRRQSVYPVNLDGTVKLLPVRDLYYVEIYNHSMLFHTGDGAYSVYGQLKTLEQDERFAGFAKSSPSHLVNCLWVTEVGADTVTVGGTVLPLSRRRRKAFLEKLASVLGGGM